MILDELDLDSLYNVGESDKGSNHLVSYVSTKKFATRIIVIREERHGDKGNVTEREHLNTIEINDVEVDKKILQKYGSVMQRLRIDYWRQSAGKAKQIASLVNEYTNVKTFSISAYDLDVLSGVQKPFNGVKELTFSGDFGKLAGANLHLNEMFPNIVSLGIVNVLHIGQGSLGFAFSQLNNLNV